MEQVLLGISNSMEQFYYVLCAVFIVGGFAALFFATEGLQKGLVQTWISTVFLVITGITLLYIGFSSLIDFYEGSHGTLDGFLDNVESVTRIFH
jgi:hypothetical protein